MANRRVHSFVAAVLLIAQGNFGNSNAVVSSQTAEAAEMAAKMAAMEEEITRLSAMLNQMSVRMNRRSFHCAVQDSWISTSEIMFDTLVLKESEFSSGGLDINTGIFTASVTGVYEITVSANCITTEERGCTVQLYLQDQHLDDKFLDSMNMNGGPILDSMASSRLVRLYQDQILFIASTGAAEIRDLKFCVSLLYMD